MLPLAAIGLGISAGSALASIGTGVFNSAQQAKANKQNFELQKQQFDYQKQISRETLDWNKQMADRDFNYNKQLQEKIFQREDSAVQRMVADNRAAGLSPIAGLAGAGTGQALEANTPQVSAPQNIPAPQMSANQLLADFSSLGQLGQNLANYELSQDRLKLDSDRLDMEKSSNEVNKRLMQSQIRATDLANELKSATLEDEIEGKKLTNSNVRSVIEKRTADIVSQALGDDIKRLSKIQTQREMAEWLKNAGIRSDLSKYGLEEAKEKALALKLMNEHNAQMYGKELDLIGEKIREIQMSNSSAEATAHAWENIEKGFGMDSGEGKLMASFLKYLTGTIFRAAGK